MATFVFVHGAFQGGWVWQKVAPLLRACGHEVHTPTLSGCGYLFPEHRPDNHLGVYVDNIANYLDIEGLDNIILVGHSFSGLICGALMMRLPQRIQHVIFVDAVIPQAGQSFVEIAGDQFGQMLEQHRLDGDHVRPWPVKVFGVEDADAAWFAPRLRPFPYQAFHTPFPGPFEMVAPISYVSCTQTMSPFIRAMAETARSLSWPVFELNTGHCPMITCPEPLENIMTTVVQPETATRQ